MAFSLLLGKLPWSVYSPYEGPKKQMIRVRTSKIAATGLILGRGYPSEFGELLDYSRSLQFGQAVDYATLIERFTSLAARLNCDLGSALDWTPTERTYESTAEEYFKTIPGLCREPINKRDKLRYRNDDDLETEVFDISHFSELSEWCRKHGRGRELTMPLQQAEVLDREIPHISAVTKQLDVHCSFMLSNL